MNKNAGVSGGDVVHIDDALWFSLVNMRKDQ